MAEPPPTQTRHTQISRISRQMESMNVSDSLASSPPLESCSQSGVSQASDDRSTSNSHTGKRKTAKRTQPVEKPFSFFPSPAAVTKGSTLASSPLESCSQTSDSQELGSSSTSKSHSSEKKTAKRTPSVEKPFSFPSPAAVTEGSTSPTTAHDGSPVAFPGDKISSNGLTPPMHLNSPSVGLPVPSSCDLSLDLTSQGRTVPESILDDRAVMPESPEGNPRATKPSNGDVKWSRIHVVDDSEDEIEQCTHALDLIHVSSSPPMSPGSLHTATVPTEDVAGSPVVGRVTRLVKRLSSDSEDESQSVRDLPGQKTRRPCIESDNEESCHDLADMDRQTTPDTSTNAKQSAQQHRQLQDNFNPEAGSPVPTDGISPALSGHESLPSIVDDDEASSRDNSGVDLCPKGVHAKDFIDSEAAEGSGIGEGSEDDEVDEEANEYVMDSFLVDDDQEDDSDRDCSDYYSCSSHDDIRDKSTDDSSSSVTEVSGKEDAGDSPNPHVYSAADSYALCSPRIDFVREDGSVSFVLPSSTTSTRHQSRLASIPPLHSESFLCLEVALSKPSDTAILPAHTESASPALPHPSTNAPCTDCTHVTNDISSAALDTASPTSDIIVFNAPTPVLVDSAPGKNSRRR